MRGCSQRAPRPGQALPPASSSTRSPSTLRVPVGALPGGKAEKPELDPSGKQQGCCARLDEPGQSRRQGQTAAPVHPQPACNVTATTQPGWHRSGSGPEQGNPGWPESTGMESGRSPRCPRHRRAGRLGAGGSQGISREQSGCWQPVSLAAGRASPPLPLQLGLGKSTKSTGSLCFISLATPAPSQAWPTRAARRKHAAVGDREFGAGAAASHMHAVIFGDCHSGVMGWPRTQGRAGHGPCPGSAKCVSLL